MENLEILLEEIVEYKMKRKLVFFVGAGVSSVSEYPNWNNLVKNMADKLSYNYELDSGGNAKFSSEELLQIPQMFCDNRGKKEYLKEVHGQFTGIYKPNEVHDLIMQLNPYHLITTNYDTLLEDAANKYGINYSVINADNKISTSESQRYILKVHGDLEYDQFVLKEEDYLNYENDYKLIDNIMKSIIATNLIVFIGYGLNDYNIKLILNWVKQVQGSTFIEPIFIYTGVNKLSKIKLKYYKQRKIRIIDTNRLVKVKDYKEKYIAILNKIIRFDKALILKNNEQKINYLYDILSDLDSFEYLRPKELQTLFIGKYYVDSGNYFVNNKKVIDYIEVFYNLLNSIETLDETIKHKVLTIQSVFRKANINGIRSNGYVYQYIKNQITEKIFWRKYDVAKEYISNTCNTTKEMYIKAYYMYILGQFKESYLLYTDLLSVTKENSEWLYYFTCQINRMFVYKTIMGYENYFKNGTGMLIYGKLQMFDEEFLLSITNEMGNFKFEDLYYELPSYVREKYKFLHRLCNYNIYTNDIIQSFESIYKINQGIAQKQVTLLGSSEFEKLRDNMIDAVRFTYDNRLLYWGFTEHKNYVRNTMLGFLIGEYERMKLTVTEGDFSQNPKYEITAQDVILIFKNFNHKDIMYLENEIDISYFACNDTSTIETYVLEAILFYEANFKGTIEDNSLRMYFMNKEEYSSICYFAHHFLSSPELNTKMIEFILECIPRQEIDDDKKIYLVRKYLKSELYGKKVRDIIENYIEHRLAHYIKYIDAFKQDIIGRTNLPEYAKILVEYEPNYKSKKISGLCNKELIDKMKCYLIKFSGIIDEEAKRYIT